MSELYTIVFAVVICAMCVGHGLTERRIGFSIFFGLMTAYNVIALLGVAK